MKALIIAKKEFCTFFSGPASYLFLAGWAFVQGIMFLPVFNGFEENSKFAAMQGQSLNLNEHVFNGTFGNACVIMLFLVPILPVRLFSDEYRQRTFDLLMTSPISAFDVMLGKFLAGLFIVWTMVVYVAIFPLLLSQYGAFEVGPVMTGFLGLFFMGAIYVSVGMFASSMTDNPILAWFLGFVIDIFLWVVGWAERNTDGVLGKIFGYLSIVTHFQEFVKGVVPSTGLIYFLSLIFMFCFLTHRVVESSRWR